MTPTIWYSGKGKTMGTVKISVVSRGWEWREEWISRTQRIFRAVKILCMILYIHVIIHLSKPIEYITPVVKFEVNYRFWMITMCQGRFINYNKCTTLVEEATRVQGQGVWRKSLCSQFCCESKIALKKKKSFLNYRGVVLRIVLAKRPLEDLIRTVSDSSTLDGTKQKRGETKRQWSVKLIQLPSLGREKQVAKELAYEFKKWRVHWPSNLGDKACVHTDKRWDGCWRGNLATCNTQWIRHASFNCTSQILNFLQIEGLWQPWVKASLSVPFFQ